MSNQVLTKKEVANLLAEKTGLTQAKAFQVVLATIDVLKEALIAGKTVTFRRFGKFEIQTVKSKIGRNPKSPEKDVIIPARCKVKFTAGNELKNEISNLNPTIQAK